MPPAALRRTLLYDEQGTGQRFSGRSINTSPLQRLGARQSSFRRLLPLYPLAIERSRPGACDVVLSSSSAFAHGIHAPEGAVHACYCHAPFRYAWYEEARAPLVVSEIVPHKRVHVALEAARRAGAPIQIVGSGPDHAALSEAYPEAEFLGRASDAELVELYAKARAVIVPSMEEFGITAVEAQAAGRPVIAAAAGGALETVIEGRTGLLAKLDDADSFATAIKSIDTLDFDPARAVRNAERFSVAAFQRRLAELVDSLG